MWLHKSLGAGLPSSTPTRAHPSARGCNTPCSPALLRLCGGPADAQGLAVPRSVVLWLGGTWSGSTALLNTATIEVLEYLVLGAGIFAAVYAAYRIAGKTHGRTGWRALIPQLVLIALLLAVNIYRFSQPMAHSA